MRHRISGNRLNRNMSLRKATIRDIAKATLIHQRICTTKPKAKEARKLVDKLITLGKRGRLADKRAAFAILCDHKLVSDLFNNTAPRFKDRAGGYTRIITLGKRRGDDAQMAFLELTEKEELIVSKPKPAAGIKKKLSDVLPGKKKETTQDKPKSKKGTDKEVEDKEVEVETQDSVEPKGKETKFMSGIRRMFKKKNDISSEN